MRHHFLFNFYAERKHCFGGSRTVLVWEMEAHVGDDRKTDRETSMPRGNLFLLTQTQTHPVQGLERVFLILHDIMIKNEAL